MINNDLNDQKHATGSTKQSKTVCRRLCYYHRKPFTLYTDEKTTHATGIIYSGLYIEQICNMIQYTNKRIKTYQNVVKFE